jgi:hypothetical protein
MGKKQLQRSSFILRTMFCHLIHPLNKMKPMWLQVYKHNGFLGKSFQKFSDHLQLQTKGEVLALVIKSLHNRHKHIIWRTKQVFSRTKCPRSPDQILESPILSYNYCKYLRYSREPGSVVGIATGYGLDDRGVGVRVPVGSRIFSSSRRPDRLWGPHSLLFNRYRGPFPRG